MSAIDPEDLHGLRSFKFALVKVVVFEVPGIQRTAKAAGCRLLPSMVHTTGTKRVFSIHIQASHSTLCKPYLQIVLCYLFSL